MGECGYFHPQIPRIPHAGFSGDISMSQYESNKEGELITNRPEHQAQWVSSMC
jgi:hypothetical protein